MSHGRYVTRQVCHTAGMWDAYQIQGMYMCRFDLYTQMCIFDVCYRCIQMHTDVYIWLVLGISISPRMRIWHVLHIRNMHRCTRAVYTWNRSAHTYLLAGTAHTCLLAPICLQLNNHHAIMYMMSIPQYTSVSIMYIPQYICVLSCK